MSRNPQIFYTSDTHIGHELVARERGFIVPGEFKEHRGEMKPRGDVQAHADALADMWDTTVTGKDTVFILGDISINGSEDALEWHRQREGHKILVTGNHDPVWPFHRDAYKKMPQWLEVFDAIVPFQRRKLGGHYFLMSHFPYTGTGMEGHRDEGFDEFLQYRLPDLGMPLLHGHTHGSERHHVSDNGTPELHVGLDAWDQKLVNQDTVQDWLEATRTRSPGLTFYI